MPGHQRILAHHLVLSGYGFWIANDPRGSGSDELREQKFADLGSIHHGRKKVQPPRRELRDFYRKAWPRLEFEPLWFRQEHRESIANAFREVVRRRKYTVWACSIGTNHCHLCIRYHRDKYEMIWMNLAAQARANILARESQLPPVHPVWADRPYSVFLHTPEDIRRVTKYIGENPEKEGLSAQTWVFVKPYDGWPLRK